MAEFTEICKSIKNMASEDIRYYTLEEIQRPIEAVQLMHFGEPGQNEDWISRRFTNMRTPGQYNMIKGAY